MSLLYQLPEDGAWVCFDIQHTFKSEGFEQAGQQTLTMASVGKTFEGAEECRWSQFTEGNLTTTVTFETRLHEQAPLGVVSTRMLFEVAGDDPPHTINAMAKLIDFGTDAKSALPGY
jgi:hypothetical protein